MATGLLGIAPDLIGPTGPTGPAGPAGPTGATGATGAAGVVIVQEGDVNVDTAVTTFDFDASDFNVTSSPAGEANITLAYGTGAGTPAEGNHTHLLAAGATDVTSSAAELNILDGATLTVTELNYVDGVTSAIQTQIDGKQPLDSDLTTIAGLTPTTNNFLVANASAWASRTPAQAIAHLGLDADIATLALPASTTISATGASLIDDASTSAMLTTLGLDTDLQTFSLPASTTITTAAATVLDDTTTGAMLTTLGAQPADADLATIAGLTATTDNVIQSVASAWASRTPAQLKTSMAFVKGDVGLGNVDNTSDANKPVSTAQQTALDLKANLASPTFTGTVVLPANQTLTTPTIAATGFTNMNHTHAGATTGGTLDAAAIASGLLANARIATGTPTGSKFLRDDQVWSTVSATATPGGSDTQVQFNDGGAMGGDAGFTYDKTADLITLAGLAGTGTRMVTTTAAGLLGSAAFDADLATFSVPASTTISAFGATLVDDADEAAGRTTLGLVAAGAGDIWVEKAGDSMTGSLGINTTAPAAALEVVADAQVSRYIANQQGPSFTAAKSRNATVGAHTIVNVNDVLGNFLFRASDGSAFVNSATINAKAIGTPGAGNVAASVTISTVAQGGGTTLVERFAASYTEVVVNDTGLPVNFRVESDTQASMLHVDGTNDRVGIANASPAVALDVTGEARVSTAGTNAASVVTVGGTQTLTAKTLTTPTIASFTNATHTHADAAGGGTLTTAALTDFNSAGDTRWVNVTGDTMTGSLILPASTTSAGTAPLKITSGTLMTAAEAGAMEFDGASLYFTDDATNGRGALPPQHYFRLSSNGSTISTIANFFGSNSAFSTVTNGVYLLEAYLYFLNTTSGTVTITLTNTQTYTNVVGHIFMSPVAGIATAGAMNSVGLVTTTSAGAAFPTSGTLTNAVNHAWEVRALIECGTAGNIRINATKLVGGTITPLRGSYYTVRRLPANNVGSFVA